MIEGKLTILRAIEREDLDALWRWSNDPAVMYFWTAEQLLAAGFAVYAVDLRGRGLSEGERFYVESIGEYVHDVATMVTLAKSREPGLPLYLPAYS